LAKKTPARRGLPELYGAVQYEKKKSSVNFQKLLFVTARGQEVVRCSIVFRSSNKEGFRRLATAVDKAGEQAFSHLHAATSLPTTVAVDRRLPIERGFFNCSWADYPDAVQRRLPLVNTR